MVPLPGYVAGLLAEHHQQVQVLGVDGGQARVQDQGLHVVLVDGRFSAGNLRPSNLEGEIVSNNPDRKKKTRKNNSLQACRPQAEGRLRTYHTMNKQCVSKAEHSLGLVRLTAHLLADGSGHLKTKKTTETHEHIHIYL